MLGQIVSLSLRHRGVVLALTLALFGYGIYVATGVKLDVFPEFVQPQVTIQCEAPGLAPDQVEVLVTRPVENTVNGVGNMESIRSESIQGLSVVTAVFKEGTDAFTARQMLAEKLGEMAGQLPDGVKSPKMSPLTSSTMDLLKIGLVSKTKSPMELRSFADWTLRPRLLSVPGVARITVYGGDVRQLQVQVQPEQLVARDLSLQDVIAAAKAAAGVRGAGFVDTGGQRVLLRAETGEVTPETLGAAVVSSHEGVSVRLRDVARVTYGPEPKFGDALIQGERGVLLAMAGQYGANTLEVTEAVEQALEELKPVLAEEGITLHEALHRPANFIESALHNVKHSLAVGGALVAVVLFLFLLDWRTAFISFISIPLSLLTAVAVLNGFGVTINTMTLGGFAVAIGVVVDDAIIDVENILRRLRENAASARPRSVLQVIVDASLEVRSAVVYATFIVALVFVPVLTMGGLQGRFFAPLGVAFILATLASLAIALTVTPALCYVLLGRAGAHAEPWYLRWTRAAHENLLRRLHSMNDLVIAVCVLLFVACALLFSRFGSQLLPDFREGHFVLAASMTPGTSLDAMLRLGSEISHEVLEDPRIASIEQQVGRAESGEDTWGPHRSEFHVELKPHTPAKEQEEVQEHLRDILKKYPGVRTEVLTFLGDRIGETISGETAEVVVSVYGDQLDTLDAKAAEVAAVLRSVQGSADVQVKAPSGSPGMTVRLRPERLTQFGLHPAEVIETLQAAYQGADVAQLYEGNNVFDMTVILDPAARRDPEGVGNLLVANADGTRLPLRLIADIVRDTGRDMIQHDGARRRQTVTCNTSGRDVASFVAEAKKRIAEQVKMPAGVYLVFSGAAEEQEHARRELVLHSVLAGAGILVLLSIVFRQPRHGWLVLSNLPFALIGGVLAVAVTGGTLSIGSLVGFVTLFGITARNGIMLLSHYEHLVEKEGAPWCLATAIQGASERLVPILMTALVTGLGLLPIALGSGEAGSEIEGPMAVVILGGLISSTALNLLVLPALALRFGRFSPEADDDSPEPPHGNGTHSTLPTRRDVESAAALT